MSSAKDHPIQLQVTETLKDGLCPDHLEVINESAKHNVPKGSETHFKVVVVSQSFQSKSLVQRHRIINESLAKELSGPVHALSIVALTPDEWQARKNDIPKSPPCMGKSTRST